MWVCFTSGTIDQPIQSFFEGHAREDLHTFYLQRTGVQQCFLQLHPSQEALRAQT